MDDIASKSIKRDMLEYVAVTARNLDISAGLLRAALNEYGMQAAGRCYDLASGAKASAEIIMEWAGEEQDDLDRREHDDKAQEEVGA